MNLKIKRLLTLVLAIGVIGFATACQETSDNSDQTSTLPVSDSEATGDDLDLYEEDGIPMDDSFDESMYEDVDTSESGLGLEDTNGTFNGNIYHNDYYGFSMTIPDHWYDQETGEPMESNQDVYLPLTLGYAEDPTDAISYLTNFFDFSISGKDEGLDDDQTLDQMITTYRQLTYDALVEEGLDDSMTKNYEENSTTFADGLNGRIATVTTTSDYGTNYTTVYLLVLPSHDIVTVMAIYDNPAAGESIMTMLNSISVDE